MAFLSITSMYLNKFITPSIGISETTTEKLKLSQNIFLASFPSSLQWAGINCSRFLILINLLFPWKKKLLSSENSTFSGFLQSNIKAIFCTFLTFLPASDGRRHTVSEPLLTQHARNPSVNQNSS